MPENTDEIRKAVNDALESAAQAIEEAYKIKARAGIISTTHRNMVTQHTNLIRKKKIKEPDGGA